MPTRNVVITDHQQQLIDNLIASGRYQNASEVLREGLRLVEERDAELAERVAAFRAAMQIGIDAEKSGKVVTFSSRDEWLEWLSNAGRSDEPHAPPGDAQ